MELSYPVLKKIGGESEVFGLPLKTFISILFVSFAPAFILSHFKIFILGLRVDIFVLFITLAILMMIARIFKAKGYPQSFFKDLVQYHNRDEIINENTLEKLTGIKEQYENIVISKDGASFVYKLELPDFRTFEKIELSDFFNNLKNEIQGRVSKNIEIQFVFSKEPNDGFNQSKSETTLAEILKESEGRLTERSSSISNYVSFNYNKPGISLPEALKIKESIDKTRFLGKTLICAESVKIFNFSEISEKGSLLADGRYYGLLSLTELPSTSSYGMFDEIKEAYSDIKISIRLNHLDNYSFKKKLERKRDLENKLSQKKGQDNIEAVERISELNEAFIKLSDGESFLEIDLSVLLSADTEEELNKSIDEVKGIIRRIDGSFYYEKYGTLKRLKQVLPVVSELRDRKLNLFSSQAVYLIPLHSKNSMERPLLPLVNSESEIFYVDPFDKCLPNKNMLIVAGSGSGKSFLAVSLILKTLKLEPNAKFIILDIGGSYKKASEILSGNYIDIDENTSFQIMPSALDAKNQNNLLVLLCAFAGSKGKQEKADIYKALQEYNKRKTKDGIGEFCLFLKKINPNLATNLSLYTSEGPYGQIFDRANSLDLNNPITCLDLKNINEFLASHEEKNLFLMALLSQIWQKFSSFDDLSTPKYLIVDECWSMINTEQGSEFLESCARTFRKHNASLITITQSIEDFTKNLASKAVVNNSCIKFILKQNTRVQIDKVCDVFGFNEREKELIESLQVEKGSFSEIFLARSGMRSLKGAYIPDKATYFIATSDPADNVKITEKKKETGTYLKAIQALALASLIFFLPILCQADMFGGDLPFLMAITSNTMQTLNSTREMLTTAKKALNNAIQTYDEIKRANDLMRSYYSGAKDGVQLSDIDLLLGNGTASAIRGVFNNAKKGKGFNRETLVGLRDSIEDTEFVNNRLFDTTKNFNDNLVKSESIKKLYGERSAKGAIEMTNLYTKSLLDLNVVEILQRHTDMEFKTNKEKYEVEMKIRDAEKFAMIEKNVDQKIKKPIFDYKDPMREQ